MSDLDKLKKALNKGASKGSALQVEDLDISKIGLYRESEVDTTDPDVVEANIGFVHKGEKLYYKKSEGKVVTYSSKDTSLEGIKTSES